MKRLFEKVMEAYRTPLPHEGPIVISIMFCVVTWKLVHG